MEDYNLIDALLDSYGILEAAHERLCSSIDPGKLDRAKFDGLRLAIEQYQSAVEAYMNATMPLQGPRRRAVGPRSVDETALGGNVHYLCR